MIKRTYTGCGDADLKKMLLKKANQIANDPLGKAADLRCDLSLTLGIALGLLSRIEDLERKLPGPHN